MMSAEQLLNRARAVMTDNEGPAELVAASCPDEHLQNQRCAVTMENLPATGVGGEGLLTGLPREAGLSDVQGSS